MAMTGGAAPLQIPVLVGSAVGGVDDVIDLN
jgi:hypothetical protein